MNFQFFKFKFFFLLQNALLDLLGGTDSTVNLMSPTMNPSDKQYFCNNAPSNAMPNNQDLLDLLGGISMNVTTGPTPFTNNITIPINDNLNKTNGNSILSMIPSTLSPLSPTMSNNIIENSLLDDPTVNNSIDNSTSMGNVKITALDKNGLNVTLVPNKITGDGTNSGCVRIVMMATNNSLNTLEQYLFQAAVPKSFVLQMLSPTGSVLTSGETITQEMRLSSSTKVSLATIHRLFHYCLFTLILIHFHYRAICECDSVFLMSLMAILYLNKPRLASGMYSIKENQFICVQSLFLF